MLKSLTKKWEINKSPLYRHIQTKEANNTFGRKLQKVIVESINTEKDMEFLKDSEELQEFIKEMNIKEMNIKEEEI